MKEGNIGKHDFYDNCMTTTNNYTSCNIIYTDDSVDEVEAE